MKTQEAIILIGLPKSGKTTFAKNFFPQYTLIECDNFPFFNKPFGFYQRCNHAIKTKKNVILDGCNHSILSRKEIINIFNDTHNISYIHFNFTFGQNLAIYKFKDHPEVRKIFMQVKQEMQFPTNENVKNIITVKEVSPIQHENKALFIPLDNITINKTFNDKLIEYKKTYKIIGISNTPKSEISFALYQNKLIDKIKNLSVHLDDFLYCWHIKEPCNCKMPKTGLFYEASKKYKINLSHSIIVGQKRELHTSHLTQIPFIPIESF